MSRSKKKTPGFGRATGSDKKDKRLANRAVRVKVKTLLAGGEEVVVIDTLHVSDKRGFKKDGKRYRDLSDERCANWRDPRWLRK